MANPPHLSISRDAIEAIVKVLADTDTGLTGSEIRYILARCKVEDTDPSMTKWKRPYNALVHVQTSSGNGEMVLGFIHLSMEPAKWRGRSAQLDVST